MSVLSLSVVALLLVGVVSWAMRVLPVTVLPTGRLPVTLQRVLVHAGPAALAAMVATALAADGGGLTALVVPSPMLVATLVSGFVAWRTRRLGLTVVVGILTLWVVELVL